MSQDIPRDVVHFTCSACGSKTWLTTEEVAHCAGTRMGCAKCGHDIDIPDGNRPAIKQHASAVRPQSEFELVAESDPETPIRRDARPNPTRTKVAAPAPPRTSIRSVPEWQDPTAQERTVASARESGELMAMPARGDGEQLPDDRRPKKKKKKKKTREQPDTSPPETEYARAKKEKPLDLELLFPAGMAVASLAMYVGVAACTVPEGLTASTYIWNKLGFILSVIGISTPALLAASALMGICYGELKVVLIKIPAIVLAQAWTEDLLTLQPLPYVPTFGAWAATLFLFVNAFELEGLEAQISMCIVRGAHSALYWCVFLGMLSSPKPADAAHQNWMFQPQLAEQPLPVDKKQPADKKNDAKQDDAKQDGDRQDARKEDGKKEKEEETKLDRPDKDSAPVKKPHPVAPQRTVEERSLDLTQKFGDALVTEDYKQAYSLMSRSYQQRVTLEAFSAIHLQAVVKYGKPLKAAAGLGDTEEGSLKGLEFERFRDVPPNDRLAWTYANLALELDQEETVRCCDCWLLLVKNGKELRVGAFEYDSCD